MRRIFAAALAPFLLAAASCRREPAPPPESLVLVTIDTLRADRVGVYSGAALTPNLDRIANEGAFARNALTQVPLTRPAHLSLFTGRYPFEHGVRQNVAQRFDADLPLLAEVLNRGGFRTGAFVSSIVLSAQSGLDRGFETFSDDFGERTDDEIFLDTVQKRGDETMREAIAWLRESSSAPFFLWIHLYDPHDPYEPPEPYLSRYRDRPYDGEVAFADELVGRLDLALEELGLSERTLLAVTSDHGEAFEEHGETGHGYFIYDTTLLVPLILRGPGIEPGTTIETPVESVDLFPTFLEMLDLSTPLFPTSGRSFASALKSGKEPEQKPLYAESLMASLLYGWGQLVSVREGPWKLIEAPRPELYNLEEDPRETENRIDRNQAAAERLRLRLASLTRDGAAAAPASSPMDPELLAKLGALGYVGSSRANVKESLDGGSHIDPKDKLAEFRMLNAAMREGLAHLERGEHEFAAERFRTILEAGEESFQALYYMGRSLYELGRLEEAATAFEGALALDPSYGPAYVDLAEVLFSLDRGEEAVAALKRGQAALPESAVLYEREGEYWTTRRRPREAALAFEAVVERVPEDPLARVRLGEKYRDLGEIERSLEHLREAVRLAPEEASYWNSLGMVLGGNDRMDEAEAAFREAHELEPDDEQYAFNLGLALSRLGRPDEARPFFEKALENDPSFEPARAELRRLGRL